MPRKIGLFLLRGGGDRMQAQLAQMRAIFEAILPELDGGTHEPEPGPTEGVRPSPIGAGERIRVPEGLAPADLSDALRRYWPESAWITAARVSYYESGWRTDAERNTLARAGGRCNVPIGYLSDGTPIVSEQSVGYFQINVCAHGHDRDYWANADNNVGYARRLYDARGWRDWQVTGRRLGLL